VRTTKPVYVAPTEDLSAAIFATPAPVGLIPPTAGFHPLIVPSNVAKMKREFAEACFSEIGLTPEMTKAFDARRGFRSNDSRGGSLSFGRRGDAYHES
jgi:hypothetical protein